MGRVGAGKPEKEARGKGPLRGLGELRWKINEDGVRKMAEIVARTRYGGCENLEEKVRRCALRKVERLSGSVLKVFAPANEATKGEFRSGDLSLIIRSGGIYTVRCLG